MTFLVLLLLAYLLGSVPWGFVVAKINGVDIQKVGSGSTGATNVSRALGLPLAVLVGSLDVLKGFIITMIAIFSLNSHLEITAVILAVVLGHVYSLFLGGKGGKGVATTFGAVFVLVGFEPMLIVFLCWVMLLFITRLMSLTNLILILLLPLYFIFIKPDLAYVVLGTALVALIYWTHRQNIERLKAGKELRLEVKVGYQKKKKAVKKKRSTKKTA